MTVKAQAQAAKPEPASASQRGTDGGEVGAAANTAGLGPSAGTAVQGKKALPEKAHIGGSGSGEGSPKKKRRSFGEQSGARIWAQV